MLVKAIKILRCSDPTLWYSNHIGCNVPLLQEYEEDYLARDSSGLSNNVKKCDCIIVDVKATDVLYLNKRAE